MTNAPTSTTASPAAEAHSEDLVRATAVAQILKAGSGLRVSKEGIASVRAAVSYLLDEILDAAQLLADAEGKKKVLPRHIVAAVKNDSGLSTFGFAGTAPVAIRPGGAASTPATEGVPAPKKRKSLAVSTSHQFASSIRLIERRRGSVLASKSRELLQSVAAQFTADLAAAAGDLCREGSHQTLGVREIVSAVEQRMTGDRRDRTVARIETAVGKVVATTA
ncbi:hypothetical protein [Streptomyces xanthochromogenes]|uniref:hypothetical protein n=1 Tax=Streptomyces xanthochromogenes TaxID=67384 RepID=UPI0038277B4F